MKMLPKEPTDGMIEKAQLLPIEAYSSIEMDTSLTKEEATKVYKAMYEAAPTVEQEPLVTLIKKDNKLDYSIDIRDFEELSDSETLLYTAPQDQSARIAELEAQHKRDSESYHCLGKAFADKSKKIKELEAQLAECVKTINYCVKCESMSPTARENIEQLLEKLKVNE